MIFRFLICGFFIIQAIWGNSDNFNDIRSSFKRLYQKVGFISHNAPEKFFGTYLIRNLPYRPAQRIKKWIE